MDSQDYYRRRREEAFKKIEEALRQKDSEMLFSYIRLLRELDEREEELHPASLGISKLIR